MAEIMNVDDNGDAKETLKVLIAKTKMVEQTEVKFDGNLLRLNTEILPHLYKQRDDYLAKIVKYEALKAQIEAELDKLPPR